MEVEELRVGFRETGVVRLDGAFSRDQAAAISKAVWGYMERRASVRPEDPATWPRPGAVSLKGLKRNPAFVPLLGSSAVSAALDTIFSDTGWAPAKSGSQVLLSFPTEGPWILPRGGWHMDCGFERPTWPVSTVRLFAFFDEVPPEGGGTLLLSGSHRLVDRYSATLPPGTGGNSVTWGKFMRQDPWLQRLYRGGDESENGREMIGVAHDIDGVPVELVELTGQPGDVVITHVHVFHCVAPNASGRPRQMVGATVTAGTPADSHLGPSRARVR